jgi:hypothetical protein
VTVAQGWCFSRPAVSKGNSVAVKKSGDCHKRRTEVSQSAPLSAARLAVTDFFCATGFQNPRQKDCRIP